MTRQITRTIKPRYISQGNTHHYRTPSYKRGSALGGKLEPMPEEPFRWPVKFTIYAIFISVAGVSFQLGWWSL